MTVVALIGPLVAGHHDLLRIDDHHEVARVDVRGVLGLALAPQSIGDLRRQAPQCLTVGVNDAPVALAVGGLGYIGLHDVKKTTRRQRAARPTIIAAFAKRRYVCVVIPTRWCRAAYW